MMQRDSIEKLRYDMEVFLERADYLTNMEKLERLEALSIRLNFIIIYGEITQEQKKRVLGIFKTVQLSLN